MGPYGDGTDLSYYRYVTSNKKTARRMMDEDRQLFIGNEDLRDAKIRDKAVESVRKNFNQSNMSEYRTEDGRTVRQFLDDCGDNDGDKKSRKRKKTDRSRKGRGTQGIPEVQREVLFCHGVRLQGALAEELRA